MPEPSALMLTMLAAAAACQARSIASGTDSK